jgi:hypothetical protein
MDHMNKASSSTLLHDACKYLTDLVIIEAIVDGGADLNPVNDFNEMPFGLI